MANYQGSNTETLQLLDDAGEFLASVTVEFSYDADIVTNNPYESELNLELDSIILDYNDIEIIVDTDSNLAGTIYEHILESLDYRNGSIKHDLTIDNIDILNELE